MDRVHRMGQTKQVTVYRLISRGTVEERIIKRATQKNEVSWQYNLSMTNCMLFVIPSRNSWIHTHGHSADTQDGDIGRVISARCAQVIRSRLNAAR